MIARAHSIACAAYSGLSSARVGGIKQAYRWVLFWLQEVAQTKLSRLVLEEQQPAQKACCGEERQELNQQTRNQEYADLQGLPACCRERPNNISCRVAAQPVKG